MFTFPHQAVLSLSGTGADSAVVITMPAKAILFKVTIVPNFAKNRQVRKETVLDTLLGRPGSQHIYVVVRMRREISMSSTCSTLQSSLQA